MHSHRQVDREIKRKMFTAACEVSDFEPLQVYCYVLRITFMHSEEFKYCGAVKIVCIKFKRNCGSILIM